MAYVALVSLIQTLEQITNTDGVSIPYEKQGLVALLAKLSLLLNFLEESSQKSSEEVKLLERRIRNAAYHAEDIIEGRSFLSRSERMMSDIEPHADLQKISIEIDSILEEAGKIPDLEEGLAEIDTHMEEAMKINDESGEQNLHARNFSQSKLAPSGQNSVVGFGEDLKKVRDRLCNEEQPQLQIIPIVGMGGSGTTTLAMSISNDSYVKYYFDIRAWVTLSQQYRVPDILLSLLDDIVVVTDNIRKARDEQLKEYVHKNLKICWTVNWGIWLQFCYKYKIFSQILYISSCCQNSKSQEDGRLQKNSVIVELLIWLGLVPGRRRV